MTQEQYDLVMSTKETIFAKNLSPIIGYSITHINAYRRGKIFKPTTPKAKVVTMKKNKPADDYATPEGNFDVSKFYKAYYK